jgi:hypothetical protein
MAVKNFWSLNVDEALVADKLQNCLKNKGYEVFFPLRVQLKDIDLVLVNLKTKKTYTVQVKGSRTYPPQKRETERFGEGQASWIQIRRKSIFEPENPIDCFIFLIHLEVEGEIKRGIELDYLVIPTEDFKKLLISSGKKIRKGDQYVFFIWINPKEKKAIDFEEWKNTIDLTGFLNNFEIFE